MNLKNALLSALVACGVAGCGGLGDGSTVETLRVTPASSVFEQSLLLNANAAGERLRVYDCMCSNLIALANFTDGTVANFGSRVKYTSSDPAVLKVLNAGETDARCPVGQQASGLLVPLALTGGTPVTITAEYSGLKDTLEVEVVDTSAATPFDLHPLAPATSQMAATTDTQLQLTATIDGYKRVLNSNVMNWEVVETTDAMTITSSGLVHGIAASATPLTARASFDVCSDATTTTSLQVGDIIPPLLIAREPGFEPDTNDALLAVNTSELLQITAALDFDGDGVANSGDTQVVSSNSKLSFTGSCTLRTFDAGQTNGCLDTPASTCDQSTPVCGVSTTPTCTAGFTACRLTATPINQGFGARNQVRADNDDGTATSFSATFPYTLATPTTLSADVPDASATTITVTSVNGFPPIPWYGVIDKAGAREDVRVTAQTGNTLTVVRGASGTTAQFHASGASFEQRFYATATPLPLTAKASTLTSLAITPPAAPLDSQSFEQLEAMGVFTDNASATRQQRVTRLISTANGAATVEWTTSNRFIANIDANTGFLLATDRCGGRVSIRARASTSTDATSEAFDPDTTDDDTACGNDPLCDQLDLCIATPNPLLPGQSCDTVTTCP